MVCPDHRQTLNNKQNRQNGTIFALIEVVDPGLSSYLSKQFSKNFQSGETEQWPKDLLHI